MALPTPGYGLPVVTDLSASDGTYTDKIILTWSAVSGATGYRIRRGTTFLYADSVELLELAITNYSDTAVTSAVLYYYWALPLFGGSVGDPSSSVTGYRGLVPPEDVAASHGSYISKVVVSWSASEGASSYGVYRAISNAGFGAAGELTKVYTAAGTAYEDIDIADGVQYLYKIKAQKNQYSSEFSDGDTGYILSSPANVTASAGGYIGRVRVTWSTGLGASSYEVWRNIKGLSSEASKVKSTTATVYDDWSVTDAVIYYYWVKSKSAADISGFSSRTSGYGAGGSVDLMVSNLVVLPGMVGSGSHPSVVSLRISNGGGQSIEPPNTKIKISLYASRNTVFGDSDDISMGTEQQDITLDIGSNAIVKIVDVSNITFPTTTNRYFIFAKVTPVYPSMLVAINDNNVTRRTDGIYVVAGGSLPYYGINDYDGDGISDLTVYWNGYWWISSVDGKIIGQALTWGMEGLNPVSGDYDGDGKSDLAVYGNGLWYVLTLDGRVLYWGANWGADGYIPLSGNYSGGSAADLAVYNSETGIWYIRNSSGYMVLGDVGWGGNGYTAVIGDYDSDGRWDMAVYYDGYWYIRAVDGTLLLWGSLWGGVDYIPVPGDYDGDGIWDLAVYNIHSGYWYIRRASGEVILQAEQWGGSGYVPVSGDFNGDGKADMAVYHEVTGNWLVRSVSGSTIIWNYAWGGAGFTAVRK